VLKLLLDEHISYDVAAGLRRRNRSLVVHCLAAWEMGSHLGLDDAALLEKAATQGLTLVTYNRRTIPTLLKAWAQEDRSHAGLIFVDEKTLPPDNNGGMVRALLNLFAETGHWDWTNRVCFLRRA
jgi:hypothetical protein